MTTPGAADTYDLMRAGGWDAPPGERLPTLLAYLGVPAAPLAEQQEALRAWMDGPAFHGAPEYLKSECRSFLEREPAEEAAPAAAQIPAQQAKWQAKLDAMFPGGAICTWQNEPAAATVPVSWIQVAGLSGLDPDLTFYHPFGWTKTGKVLISLNQSPDGSHLWAARFADGSSCLLSSVVPDGLAEQLAGSRADVMTANPVSAT